MLKVFRDRGKTARWVAEMQRQADERAFIHTPPPAVVLDVVDNGDQGWKWLTWDYDPDQKRLLAGQVEGVCVPYGIKAGYKSRRAAREAGLLAIRKAGWTGDVVLREAAI